MNPQKNNPFILAVLFIGVVIILFVTARTARVAIVNWASHNGMAAVSMVNCTVAEVLGNWGLAKPLSPGNCNGDGMVDGMDLALALSGGPVEDPQDPVEEDPNEEVVEDPVEEDQEEDVVSVFLVPGSGFTAPTPTPSVQGDPSMKGADEKAIARWAMVPYQTINQDTNIVLVADHYNGIAKVEFSVDGGPWATVNAASVDESTNVEGYVATMRIADFSDGLHEIRAIIYPKHGIPLVLGGTIANSIVSNQYTTFKYTNGIHSMFINTDRDGTLPKKVAYVAINGNDTTGDGTAANPVQTLMQAAHILAGKVQYGDAGGGTIYLQPGDYNLGTYSFNKIFNTASQYLIITPAPGVSRDQVRIISSSPKGLQGGKIRFYNITFAPKPGTIASIQNTNQSGLGWFDKAYFTSQNFNDQSSSWWYDGWQARYFTNSEAFNVRDTPFNGTMGLNIKIEKTTDAFKNLHVILNAKAKNVSNQGTADHPDVWQSWNQFGTLENFFVQNLEAVDTVEGQGLFFHGFTFLFTNGVFKNVKIDNSNNGIGNVFVNLHAGRPMKHVLFRNVEVQGCGLYRLGDNPDTPMVSHNIFSSDDMLMENVYKKIGGNSVSDFCVPNPDGPAASIGDPGDWPGTLPWLSPLNVYYSQVQ